MRIVVDTNVLISAVFFGGKPGFILDAWRDRKLEFIITEETLAEYVDVLHRFGIRYPGVNTTEIATLIVTRGVLVESIELDTDICKDPDDDKFVAAALGGSAGVIVTGDKHLLDVSGYRGIQIMPPADFLMKYLSIN